MKKVIGFVLMILGLASLALGIPQINSIFIDTLPIPAVVKTLNTFTLTIIGLVLILFGIFFSRSKGSGKKPKQDEEVPIYHGQGKERTIVGYQRMTEGKGKK